MLADSHDELERQRDAARVRVAALEAELNDAGGRDEPTVIHSDCPTGTPNEKIAWLSARILEMEVDAEAGSNPRPLQLFDAIVHYTAMVRSRITFEAKPIEVYFIHMQMGLRIMVVCGYRGRLIEESMYSDRMEVEAANVDVLDHQIDCICMGLNAAAANGGSD